MLIRAVSLDHFVSFAASLGLNAETELARVGLSPEMLLNPKNFVPFARYIRLLQQSAVAGNCPDFGMRLALRQGGENAGPLMVLMRHAATLKESLGLGARYIYLYSPAFQFDISPVNVSRTQFDVSFEMNTPLVRHRAQAIEHMLGFFVQVLGLITQRQVRPLLAMLPHQRMGPSESYAEALQCDCRFQAPRATLRLASKDLIRTLPGQDPLIREMAKTYIEQNYTAPQSLFVDRVRSLLRKHLATGRISTGEVALALAIHPKTMQRRLLQDGHQFQQILDEIRCDRLLELLEQSQTMHMAQMAIQLGYSEQAALSRSCRRWFGCTPTKMLQRVLISKDHGT